MWHSNFPLSSFLISFGFLLCYFIFSLHFFFSIYSQIFHYTILALFLAFSHCSFSLYLLWGILALLSFFHSLFSLTIFSPYFLSCLSRFIFSFNFLNQLLFFLNFLNPNCCLYSFALGFLYFLTLLSLSILYSNLHFTFLIKFLLISIRRNISKDFLLKIC